MQLVIAEKPSVARDLARALGVRAGGGKHAIEGPRVVFSWCIGHLVELDEPASYDARWKAWRLDTLPMLPAAFKLRPVARTRDQLDAVSRLLRDARFSEVVNACDAGREGELIFRYVYELAKSRLPVRRLWISSMTDEAINAGWKALRRGEELDPLAAAARCRSEADWLVGLNATRAVTVRHRRGENSPLYSIGRVQTPTLAIVVDRDKAIDAFVPRDYWEVRGRFATEARPAAAGLSDSAGATFHALWTHDKRSRLGARALADDLCARAAAHEGAATTGAVVERVHNKRSHEPPPFLFDLTSLQRTANRRFGLSAAATLEAAQALYERHKALSYPRTNSRHLSRDIADELPKLFRGLAALPEYTDFVAPLLAKPPAITKRVFDDGKVEDHHAIIPTGKAVRTDSLSRDEARIFDLVVRRFLGAFYPDAEFALSEVIVRVGADAGAAATAGAKPQGDRSSTAAEVSQADNASGGPKKNETAEDAILSALPAPPDRFVAKGRVRLVAGWQTVAGFGNDERDNTATGAGKTKPKTASGSPSDGSADAEPTLPVLQEGQRLTGTYSSTAKQTKPPPRHTEATLLGAMETAGRTIEDDELRAAMKDSGLGTPATRAATIETLVKRQFVRRDGKQLHATPTGFALIAALPTAELASPELTGTWEARLARIARGTESRATFMRDIASYVTRVVDGVRGRKGDAAPVTRAVDPAPQNQRVAETKPEPQEEALACPRCKEGTLVAGKRGWGCTRWREGCAFVVWFTTDGNSVTAADLRDLVTKGKTRKKRDKRFVLDLDRPREEGAARLTSA